jgi:subtilisin family serine protease
MKQTLLRSVLFLSILPALIAISAHAGAETRPTSPARASVPWMTKVDPALLADTADGATAEFLVVLVEQADLSGAARLIDKADRGRYVYETLTAVAARTQAPLRTLLDRHGAAYRPYWVSNFIWVRGDQALVQALAARNEVHHVYANPWQQVQLPTPTVAPGPRGTDLIVWNIEIVRAPQVWAEGFTGQGVVIGGQDTGYQWDHPALRNKYRGWNGSAADHNYNWHDAIHEDLPQNGSTNTCGFNLPAPCDDDGHGTHTMGTMVGDNGQGLQIGMAPGAKWIGCRNMDEGLGSPATYAECFEWFIAPYPVGGDPFTDGDPVRAPDVINNSWSCPQSEGCVAPDVLQAVVEAVRAAGILTVQSAGNGGPNCSTISTPAAIYDASFTVGATDDQNLITGFSSRGPVTADGSGRLKPDIVAPGQGIESSVPGNSYAFLSGTSMAAPHVAGLVALLISAEPDLAGRVSALEEVMTQSALNIKTTEGCGTDTTGSVPNNVYGWGRIDALAAYELLGSEVIEHDVFMPVLVPR